MNYEIIETSAPKEIFKYNNNGNIYFLFATSPMFGASFNMVVGVNQHIFSLNHINSYEL